MKQKGNISKFIGEIPGNLFAGFVVSLIALPLGLGLALASGAPPIAGIVSAVVGGVIVSVFGGSHVTISGPGNGLVVAVLGAITLMGEGDLFQGYLYTLAAIMCSGFIILILGFASLGKISDFFPSSAIQGLLAAIGIIILSKQFHIMVGNMDSEGSTIELLIGIPAAIFEGFTDEYRLPAALAGLASLLIMILYPRIRNKYFQLIPAPMWIVMISIGLAWVFERNIGVKHPIPLEYFVNIPNDVFSHFPRPDFSKAFTGNFLLAVFSITVIASIESLLSIKAVDKLDPLRRRSNVNRDLKALGLATMVSAFFGGLNVVTVIARSSVNANNNATNRSSNFFHGMFLVLFILLFKKQLQHIPFPTLAAILVYTGYKLASPAIIKKISEIGKEQVFIFTITLMTTILSSIIAGILVGIFVTLLTHIYLTKNFRLFFENIFKNNIETFDEPDGKLHVSVKHFSSFLNFYRLKQTLDKVGTEKKVVVDFLQSRFVDHTVMQNMWDYEHSFDINGGEFEVIGLDLHNAESEHPSSLRRALEFVPFVPDESRMTRRQKMIDKFCQDIGWDFEHKNDYHMYFLAEFDYFRTRQVDHLYNIGKDKKEIFRIFDIEYSEGFFIAEEELHASMVYIDAGKEIPAFTLSKGDLYERLHYLGSYKEIRLRTFRDFANRFALRADNLRAIRRFFNDDLILFLESNNYYHIESNGKGGILIMDKERHSGVGEIKAMVNFALRFHEVISVEQ
ncbi:MAG: SulP family inorganic anion transporter [Flavobacteriales bacterium]|nr:SulP family inorganic anion transporter [Flavobacteriales bacterium]